MKSRSEPPDPDADPEEVARTIVLRLLTGQARTREELAEALRRRNVPAEAADAVLSRMTEVGLIDDEEFARSWVDSRQQRRHLSRRVLRRELRDRGVGDEVIDDAVAGVTVADELRAAAALVEKKSRSLQRLDPRVQERRLAGALARRGFSGDVIRSVLRDLDLPGRDEGDAE